MFRVSELKAISRITVCIVRYAYCDYYILCLKLNIHILHIKVKLTFNNSCILLSFLLFFIIANFCILESGVFSEV